MLLTLQYNNQVKIVMVFDTRWFCPPYVVWETRDCITFLSHAITEFQQVLMLFPSMIFNLAFINCLGTLLIKKNNNNCLGTKLSVFYEGKFFWITLKELVFLRVWM